jgi:hypothetical protein
MLELIRAIVEKKLRDLKIVVGDFFIENFRELLFNSLYLSEVLVVEPARDLYLTFVSLFKIYG